MKEMPNNLRKIRTSHPDKELRSGNKIAELMDISPQYYYDLETGRGGRKLNAEHINKLTKIFKVSSDEILGQVDLYTVFSSVPEFFKPTQESVFQLITQLFNTHGIKFIEEAAIITKIPKNDLIEALKSIENFKTIPIDWQSAIFKSVFIIGDNLSNKKGFAVDDHISATNNLSLKEERDIANDLEKMLSDLANDNEIAFQGEPMDDDEREMLRISLENSMRLAKQMAKKKISHDKNND